MGVAAPPLRLSGPVLQHIAHAAAAASARGDAPYGDDAVAPLQGHATPRQPDESETHADCHRGPQPPSVDEARSAVTEQQLPPAAGAAGPAPTIDSDSEDDDAPDAAGEYSFEDVAEAAGAMLDLSSPDRAGAAPPASSPGPSPLLPADDDGAPLVPTAALIADDIQPAAPRCTLSERFRLLASAGGAGDVVETRHGGCVLRHRDGARNRELLRGGHVRVSGGRAALVPPPPKRVRFDPTVTAWPPSDGEDSEDDEVAVGAAGDDPREASEPPRPRPRAYREFFIAAGPR